MSEINTFQYKLPSGALIEVQNLPTRERGAGDVSHGPEEGEPLPLETVLSPLGEVVQLVFEQLQSAVRTPSTVHLEVGASLKGKSSLVLVSGETTGTIKVSLTWNNSE